MTELHAALQGCVDEPGGEGFRMLRHPLIHTIYLEEMNEQINNTYVHKMDCIERAEKDARYESAIWYRERPYRVDALYLYQALLSPAQLHPLIAAVWADTEAPHQSLDKWLDLWRKVAPITNDLARLSLDWRESVTKFIYRGQNGNRVDGLSWSLDRERAEWFAHRSVWQADDPRVITKTIQIKDVVAYISGRGEAEIICIDEGVFS